VLHTAGADRDTIELQAETSQSHIRIALAARTRVFSDSRQLIQTADSSPTPGSWRTP